ncbi:MAG TPA: ThiF family adenylyltransferase [Terriglobales bacterium]|nr:ThiF family adenylyltransferase [Terriglobales bacterium]
MTESASRYSRQLLFAPLGAAGQGRLAQARVAVVGCGALGSAQAEMLARAGVGRLRIIDRDFVEASNLQRQWLFDEEDAEQRLPKAIAAERRLGRINHEVVVEPRIADLEPNNAAALLADCDVVVDGTDNFETRFLLNDFAVANAVPWIYGAAVAARGATFTIIPEATACLSCVFPEPPAGLTDTCESVGVLGWAVAWVAAQQVGECVKLLAGARDALRRSWISADLWSNQFRELAAPPRDPECPTCAQRDFRHLRGDGRAAITLCGRNAVQIHEHHRPLDLAQLSARLGAHGLVRSNSFALRFLPRDAAPIEMTVFPDGRALIQGTTETAVARSLYARYLGA